MANGSLWFGDKKEAEDWAYNRRQEGCRVIITKHEENPNRKGEFGWRATIVGRGSVPPPKPERFNLSREIGGSEPPQSPDAERIRNILSDKTPKYGSMAEAKAAAEQMRREGYPNAAAKSETVGDKAFFYVEPGEKGEPAAGETVEQGEKPPAPDWPKIEFEPLPPASGGFDESIPAWLKELAARRQLEPSQVRPTRLTPLFDIKEFAPRVRKEDIDKKMWQGEAALKRDESEYEMRRTRLSGNEAAFMKAAEKLVNARDGQISRIAEKETAFRFVKDDKREQKLAEINDERKKLGGIEARMAAHDKKVNQLVAEKESLREFRDQFEERRRKLESKRVLIERMAKVAGAAEGAARWAGGIPSHIAAQTPVAHVKGQMRYSIPTSAQTRQARGERGVKYLGAIGDMSASGVSRLSQVPRSAGRMMSRITSQRTIARAPDQASIADMPRAEIADAERASIAEVQRSPIASVGRAPIASSPGKPSEMPPIVSGHEKRSPLAGLSYLRRKPEAGIPTGEEEGKTK